MSNQWLPTRRCIRINGKTYKHGDEIPINELSEKARELYSDDIGTVKKPKPKPADKPTEKKGDKK